MREVIQHIVKGMIKSTNVVGKVISVDSSNYTITVQLNESDLKVDGVRLRSVIETSLSSGIFIEPKVGSFILVGIVDNNTSQMFVAAYSEITSIKFITDQIHLAGDTNGGLIKINDLKTQWDANVNAIKTACIAGFSALAGLDGSASLNAFNGASGAIKVLNKTTLENSKVKHG